MIKIKVPATSANIGPGFDCLGIALNLFNTFYIEEIENGLVIENCPDEFKNDNNLTYRSMVKLFNDVGYKYKGLRIRYDSEIPICSGLGSSSTCILAGIISANEISDSKLSLDNILNISTGIEGHSDNITPALLGGFTMSALRDNVYFKRFTIEYPLTFYSITPNFHLSTKTSRSVLPKLINLEDATFNIASSSLVLSSLITGDLNILKHTCQDKIHEQYRAKFIPNFYNIKNQALNNNALTVYLSGAGPTIMCIVDPINVNFYEDMNKYLNTLEEQWCLRALHVCNKGTEVEIY